MESITTWVLFFLVAVAGIDGLVDTIADTGGRHGQTTKTGIFQRTAPHHVERKSAGNINEADAVGKAFARDHKSNTWPYFS